MPPAQFRYLLRYWPLLIAALLIGCNAPPLATPALRAHTPMPVVAPGAVMNNATPTLAPAPRLTPTPSPDLIDSAAVAPVIPVITLNVELMYRERWLRVRHLVEVENTSSEAWDELTFNVSINATPDTFYLDAATVTLGDRIQNGTPSLFGAANVLRLPLPRPAEPGEVIQAELRYRIVIQPVAATSWPPIGVTGWTFDLIQVGDWYPTLVPYIEGEGWRTWEYHPVGDPNVYPAANYDLFITTDDAGIEIASGGLVSREGGDWHFHVDQGRGIAFIASDRYQVSERDADGVLLRSHYLPEHAEAGEAALDIAADSLALFEELYGPYAYDSLTIGENGFFGGMEYSAFISITDFAYYTYSGQPNSILAALVSHETAHQWWYSVVGNDQVYEPWLDESLAFYSELLYFERYHPEAVDWWWENRVLRFEPYGPVDATIYSYAESADFILSMYGQAALFTHDLRNLMGDKAFFAFLQDYYQTYAGQIVTADDFFATARRHTSADLDPLLQAYFANPAH